MLGWLDDPETDLPMSDEQRARLRQEAAAEAVKAERERIERETEADEREQRLTLEARLAGKPFGKELVEVLSEASEQGARQDRAEERRRRVEGSSPPVLLDSPPHVSLSTPRRRPPEVQAVADGRERRKAREYGADLAANGHPILGGLVAALLGGKRP